MFKSLKNVASHREQNDTKARADYSRLLMRLATKDDLPDAEVEQLEKLHQQYGEGEALEHVAAELQEHAQGASSHASGLSKAERSLAEAESALSRFDAESDEIHRAHNRLIEERTRKESDLIATATAATGAVEHLARQHGQRLRDIAARRWKLIGMASAPTADAEATLKQLRAELAEVGESLATEFPDISVDESGIRLRPIQKRRYDTLRARKRQLTGAIDAAESHRAPVEPTRSETHRLA